MTQEPTPYALRVAQAVRHSSVDRSTLYRAMREGSLPYIRRGRIRLIRVTDLQRWLDSLLVQTPGDQK